MRFLTECKVDAASDMVYYVCSLHLLKPVELSKDKEPGQVLGANGIRPQVARGCLVWRPKMAEITGAPR